MARIPMSVIIGFVVPIVLLFVNLIWGYGGILALILLLVWIGIAVFLVTPEDRETT